MTLPYIFIAYNAAYVNILQQISHLHQTSTATRCGAENYTMWW